MEDFSRRGYTRGACVVVYMNKEESRDIRDFRRARAEDFVFVARSPRSMDGSRLSLWRGMTI